MNIFDRFREAWVVFRGRDHPSSANNVTQFKGWDSPMYGASRTGIYTGPTSYDRPDRFKLKPGNERSIVNAAYNKIALDVAKVEIHHAKVDENEFFTESINDELEELFNVEANLDQTSMAYMIDLVMSMFDEGVVAEVPINFDSDDPNRLMDPAGQTPRAIEELRLGRIVSWKPREVEVELYNAATGQKERIIMGKREVCIHENPFYSVMNEKNSIYHRLIKKLNVLDSIDNNYGSDKLNMVVQLPYIVRTDAQRALANNRINEMEKQLKTSPHGIAYVDGTEKITQISRPLENNLQSQVEWLTKMFFDQLNINEEILNGTADDKAMSNYMDRVVGTVLEAICSERKRKLLTKDQRANGESIVYVQDPLRLIPATSLSDIFDKLSRNAILSPNECRGVLGYKPSQDPSANQLVNRNMPVSETPEGTAQEGPVEDVDEGWHSAIPRKRPRKKSRASGDKMGQAEPTEPIPIS